MPETDDGDMTRRSDVPASEPDATARTPASQDRDEELRSPADAQTPHEAPPQAGWSPEQEQWIRWQWAYWQWAYAQWAYWQQQQVRRQPETLPSTARPSPPLAPLPEGTRDVFGLDPDARPGRVPWGWRDVLVALGIAIAPIAALSAVALLSPTGSASDKGPESMATVVAIVVSTVLIDGWVLLWSWVFSVRRRQLPLRSLGLRGTGAKRGALIGAGLVFAGLCVTYTAIAVHGVAYRWLVGPPPKQDVMTVFPHSAAGIVLFGVTAVAVAPIFEEMVFRGFVFQGLSASWGPVPGALVSGLLFGASHLQPSFLFPMFALGVVLAAVFYWTRSLWASVALHTLFNLLGFLAWSLTA